MDCLVAVPSDRLAVAGATPLPAGAASAACIVGSPMMRSTMFLPRLHSIPEAAEPSITGDDSANPAAGHLPVGREAVAAASAATSSRIEVAEQSAQYSLDATCSSSQSCEGAGTHAEAGSSQLKHSSSTSSSLCCCARGDADLHAAECQDCGPSSPTVDADSWALSIRHFTEAEACLCLPSAASCSSSQRQGEAASSTKQQQQHAAASANRSVAPSSSSNSLAPAAADDMQPAEHSALLGSLTEADMDATEWQPWDRVARWLELHSAETAAAAHSTGCCSSGSSSCGDAAAPCAHHHHHQQQQQQSHHHQPPPLQPQQQQQQQRRQARHNRVRAEPQSDPQQQQQQQQQQSGTEELLFDAPDWWQESVKARLQEQREAFQSSWWCRLKVLTGLAAQRATCAL